RFPDFTQIWRSLGQEIQSCSGVVACGGDRLLDLVSERSRQYSHHDQAVEGSEVLLQLAQPLMLLLRTPDCCHIGAGAAIATEFSVDVKHRFTACLHVHWRAAATHGAIDELT